MFEQSSCFLCEREMCFDLLRSAGDEGQGGAPAAGRAPRRLVPVAAVGREPEEEEGQFQDELQASVCEQRGGVPGRADGALGTRPLLRWASPVTHTHRHTHTYTHTHTHTHTLRCASPVTHTHTHTHTHTNTHTLRCASPVTHTHRHTHTHTDRQTHTHTDRHTLRCASPVTPSGWNCVSAEDRYSHVVDDQLMRFFERCRGYVEGVEKNRSALLEVDKFKYGDEMEGVRRRTEERLNLPQHRLTPGRSLCLL